MPRALVRPTATIPLSPSTAAPNAWSWSPPRSVVAMPLVPKVWSRLPDWSWRVSAKSVAPPVETVRHPAATIPPVGWITTASAWLPRPPTGVDTRPPFPNEVSSPSGTSGVVQCTATSVTFALLTVPLPL